MKRVADGKALRALVVLLGAMSSPAGWAATPSVDVSSAGYVAHKAAVDFCRARAGSAPRAREGVACLDGRISTELVEEVLRARPLRTVVVRTGGGETRAAMALGRAIYRDRAALVVDGICFSSCANYLVPAAAFRLTILDRSFVGLHGSPPRDHHRAISDQLAARGLTRQDVAARPDLYREALRTYSGHVETHVVEEVRYFGEILVPEGYVTRFFELVRSIRHRRIERCLPDRGTMLIAGPEYLRMFRIVADFMWWPEDRAEIVAQIPDGLQEDYAIIFDADEHIGWSRSKGFLTAAECMPG